MSRCSSSSFMLARSVEMVGVLICSPTRQPRQQLDHILPLVPFPSARQSSIKIWVVFLTFESRICHQGKKKFRKHSPDVFLPQSAPNHPWILPTTGHIRNRHLILFCRWRQPWGGKKQKPRILWCNYHMSLGYKVLKVLKQLR